MIDITETLRLDNKDQQRLKEIINYMLRGTDDKVYMIYDTSITVDREVGNNSRTYKMTSVVSMLYYVIPKFFNIGIVALDLCDPVSVLDFFYQECKMRTQSEETSEEIPINE